MERVYASIGDYSNFTGARGPSKLDRRSFVAASRRVDRELRGAIYATDTNGMPTAPAVRQALREAVCAQVEAWVAAGDPTGTGVVDDYSTVSIGDVSFTKRPSSSTGVRGPGSPLAEKALDILMDVGLLPVMPWVVG